MNQLEFSQNEELEQLVKAETVENYELPPDIVDLAERVSCAVTLLSKKILSGKPDYVLVKRIMDLKLCSRPSALKALQLAKALMVRTSPFDVNYQKLWLDTSIKRNIAKSEESATPKDRDAISKEHKNLIKLHGLDKEQGEAPRNVLIINVINHNPELIGAQKRGNIKGDVLAAIEAAKTKQEKQFGEILDITELKKEHDDSEES
jgi:hypothetical protein